MNKKEVLERYNKEEEKLLIAKLIDKINTRNTQNKIEHTDFLDMYQKKICQDVLNTLKERNYTFYGGFEGADKNILILYPDKLERVFENNQYNFNTLMKAIKITLPNELKGTYMHRDYLSGLMKLGIKREKCGDILIEEKGAYIIVQVELADYIKDNLQALTRFIKSKVEIIDLEQIKVPERKKEEKCIRVSAMRLDSIIAEIAYTSRTGANELIESGRVFVNYENETRKSRNLNEKDVIVIRGKGKFEISKIEGNTKKGKIIVMVEHYV